MCCEIVFWAVVYSPVPACDLHMHRWFVSQGAVQTADRIDHTVSTVTENRANNIFASVHSEQSAQSSAHITVGMRCETSKFGMGCVRFIGQIKGKVRIGIELDKPIGLNNGTVFGKQFFKCAPKHGVFLLPDVVRSVSDAEKAEDDCI